MANKAALCYGDRGDREVCNSTCRFQSAEI